MTFRIQRAATDDGVVLTISGEIAEGHESDLRALLDAERVRTVVLDLAGLTVVDRDGIRVLAGSEARGAMLTNCPGYVREWIDRERQESRMTTVRESVAREDTFTGSGGVKLSYRSWRPTDSARAVLVIVPGFNSHSGYYEWAAGRLTAAGVAVYAVDLRGRGKSDGERFFVAKFDEYLSDVDGMVNVARSDEPDLPVFVLGHSAGGVLACLYTLDHQARLAGLICESFAFQTPAPDFALAVLKGLGHVFPHAHVLHLKNEDFSRDGKVVEAMNADPLIANETQPTQTVAELVRADERLKNEFPLITLPVLILHGTSDKATKPAGSQYFYDMAQSRDKTLKLYDGYFHDLLNDLGRETVMTDITAWIQARLPGGAQ
jgi:alpha-beta hydrolase superfamily lysophospholipase